MDTMLSIKIDKTLKNKARETAQALGVSLNAVINQYIKEFVTAREITFVEHPHLHERTRRVIKEVIMMTLETEQEPKIRSNLKKLAKKLSK